MGALLPSPPINTKTALHRDEALKRLIQVPVAQERCGLS
jgi:hypothetical protein